MSDFVFALHNQSDCYRLHTSGRESRFEALPQHRRKLEAYNSVEYSAGLLRIDSGQVDFAWMCDSIQNGFFCNLVEDDSPCVFRLESEDFVKVPCDSFSFAVFIGCEPYHFGVVCSLLQIGNKLCLVFRNLIYWFEAFLYIDAETFLFQIAYMSVAGHHPVVAAEEFFNGFCFGRRFDDYKIFGCAHICSFLIRGQN